MSSIIQLEINLAMLM